MTRGPTAIDLFCGAGGLSLGLQRAGFSVIRAYDHWEPAIATYRANFSHAAERVEIGPDLDLPQADVIVGGPPCQGFSSAGMRREDDERNSLIALFAALVSRARPAAFVFENVEGFLTGAGGRFVFELLSPLVGAGYRVHVRKINAANYGIPQHRKRVIAIGGLGWNPSFPAVTHSAYGAPGAQLASQRLPPTPSLANALAGLPPAVSSDTGDNATGDHEFAALRHDDLARARLLKPGQCMRDLPEELWHPSYRRRAYRRVRDGTPTERRGGAPAGLRRLRLDEPSKAITGGAVHEFLHPTEDRPLTLRECARLQTFPDDFHFRAATRDAVQLVGNAVPPLLAQRIGETLHADLARARPLDSRGALLTFVATLSNGMSPALRAVLARIDRIFPIETSSGQMELRWA